MWRIRFNGQFVAMDMCVQVDDDNGDDKIRNEA